MAADPYMVAALQGQSSPLSGPLNYPLRNLQHMAGDVIPFRPRPVLPPTPEQKLYAIFDALSSNEKPATTRVITIGPGYAYGNIDDKNK